MSRTRKNRKTFGFGKIVITAMMIAALGFGFAAFSPFSGIKAKASTNDLTYVTYVVQTNDTLWDLAQDHICDAFPTCDGYVQEVIRANKLKETGLYEGQLLLIPVEKSDLMLVSSL